MKPYIVRPVEPGMARSIDRGTGARTGLLLGRFIGWSGFCDCAWEATHHHRADAAEALWRHYLDEHKEQAK